MTGAAIAVLVVTAALLLGTGYLLGRRTARPLRPSDVGTPVEHATFETLHTASLAAPPLRALPPRRAPAAPPAGCAPCSAPTPSASPTGTGCWSGTAPGTTTARTSWST